MGQAAHQRFNVTPIKFLAFLLFLLFFIFYLHFSMMFFKMYDYIYDDEWKMLKSCPLFSGLFRIYFWLLKITESRLEYIPRVLQTYTRPFIAAVKWSSSLLMHFFPVIFGTSFLCIYFPWLIGLPVQVMLLYSELESIFREDRDLKQIKELLLIQKANLNL